MNPQATHAELTDTLREELALYAFGLLEGDEAKRIARHLKMGCRVCSEEFRASLSLIVRLSSAVEPVTPASELRARLITRVRNEKQDVVEHPEPGISIVRGGRGKWMQTPWKGVAYMRLRYDRATGFTTALLRIDPGARYPAHHHNGVEQSWVLQGSCRIGSVTIRAGDFACAEAGTDHGALESEDGCVLLIMSSVKDEVFA